MTGPSSPPPGSGPATGESAIDLLNAALFQARTGDLAAAEALIAQALRREPRNPAVLTGRAVLHRVQGRMRDAVLACDAALRIEPRMAGAWLERGMVLSAGGSPAAALESFARAAELAPESVDAQAQLAALAARQGDHDRARAAAERALARDQDNLTAATALGQVLLAAGEAQHAADLLSPIVARAPLDESRASALNQLGRAREALGDHAAAYTHFAQGKQDFAQLTAGVRARSLANTDFIAAIHRGLQAAEPAAWTAPAESPGPARPEHTFLLGYPRSGTTLVENILASLPGVAALEERPTLLETDRQFLLGGPNEIAAGVEAFAQLDAAALDGLRHAYWEKVGEAGVSTDTAHFVDMDPLKGTRLPFIARLFPKARVVIMRRDPRDVVWSCFRTDFALTPAALEFTALDSAARHYDALMRLTQDAVERLDLTVFDLRYESLVVDFDRTTRELCTFLGLTWSEEVRAFARTAGRRGVATASSGQVKRGLYDGSGQWQPYARWLEPVLPTLQPWIDRFGYA